MTQMPPSVRTALAHPALADLWARAHARLQTTGLVPAGHITVPVPDAAAAVEIGSLTGRDLRSAIGRKTRVDLAALDARLRAGAAARPLAAVVTEITGREIRSNPEHRTAKADRDQAVADTIHASLAAHGLQGRPWVEPWVASLRRNGQFAKLAEDRRADVVAPRAAAVLARLHLEPTTSPHSTVDRGDLASRCAGGAHGLDDDQFLAKIVLRAAASAHGVQAPADARSRRDLWARCGVTVDEISSTAITWALPILGDDRWATGLRERTACGLESHLTRRELRLHRPDPESTLVAAGTIVAVCENPRLIAAAADAGIRMPMVCTFGMPTTLVMDLLRRLGTSGAELRYHGDFDAAGLIISELVLTGPGTVPWRMGAPDYRAAVAFAQAGGIELPELDDAPGDASWDPELGASMRDTGLAAEEEVLIDLLLGDLARWATS